VCAKGTRLRAMASSIRYTTAGRESVDAPSRSIQRVWLPDPATFSQDPAIPYWTLAKNRSGKA
jgi:hypothetical protein